MDVSVNWLRELVPGLDEAPERLADRLSMRAVPVDGVRHLGRHLEGIVVARAVSVERHPNADRLWFCRIDPGSGETVELVCGAPTVEQGALYAWVPPGATLPGGMKIQARKIRGFTSHGMLCSEHELGLGRDKGGILRLPPDLEPGAPLSGALGLPDAALLLDLTPNRVDLACHVGVARELAEAGDAGIHLRALGTSWEPEWRNGESESEVADVRVVIEDLERCPRYLGAVVRDVAVGPSPAWLAGRLRAAGTRPINNVVDATNYVLLELNQPLHAFDLGRIRGGQIRVRPARAGEELRTLDGETRTLEPAATVIADGEGAVALAGVMGGEESEVTERTTDVFLECAAFDPRHARHTARSNRLSTAASYRFERGIDELGLERALGRCVELVLAVAGGGAASGAARAGRPAPERAAVRLRPERVRRVLGVTPDGDEIRRALGPLGFEVADARNGEEPGELTVLVPGWRRDVTREVDLIEEVARRHGYENFPDEVRRFRPSSVPDDPAWERIRRVRERFRARGFLEARSSSLVPEVLPGGRSGVALLNPLSGEEGFLRSGIVPVLLRRLEHNWARGRRAVRLFEIGTVFRPGPSDAAGRRRFAEEMWAGAVLTGPREPPHWSRESEDADRWDLKGLAEELAGMLTTGSVEPAGETGAGGSGPGPESVGMDWLAAGGFRILTEGRVVGVAGPVREEAVDAPPWAAPVWALEFRIDAVPSAAAVGFARVSPYPAVGRDLAVTVPRGAPAAAVERAIRAAGEPVLESASLFDVYEGAGIEAGRRSLAWALRFRSPDRTLTDEEVEDVMRRVISALEEGFDARVRTA